MNTEDLIASAELLLNRPGSDPTQADINRAASTCYYALFHELSQKCADVFMGAIHKDFRRAWQQVYRALGHDTAKQRCRHSEMMIKFPDTIQDFADQFVKLQELRHQCDYDPLSETTKSDVESSVKAIRELLPKFRNTQNAHLKAFCAYLVFPTRDDPLRADIEKERKKAKKEAEIVSQKAAGEAKRAERAAKKAAREAAARAAAAQLDSSGVAVRMAL